MEDGKLFGGMGQLANNCVVTKDRQELAYISRADLQINNLGRQEFSYREK